MIFVWAGAGLVGAFLALVVYLYFAGADEARTESSVDMAATPERAFEVFTDFSRWERIWKGISGVEAPEKALREGSTFAFQAAGGERMNAKVSRIERGTGVQFSLVPADGGAKRRVTLRFEKLPKGTRVALVNETTINRRVDRVRLRLMRIFETLRDRDVLWRLKVEAEADD